MSASSDADDDFAARCYSSCATAVRSEYFQYFRRRQLFMMIPGTADIFLASGADDTEAYARGKQQATLRRRDAASRCRMRGIMPIFVAY